MRIQLTGVLEDNPQPDAGGVCTMTVAAEGELLTVAVSNRHAQWVVSTFDGGQLVEIIGAWARPGVIHAWAVWPVGAPVAPVME